MYETSKTSRLAGSSFPDHLFVGRGIDIGCGDDLVCANVEPFDKIHGDANDILNYKQRQAYDFVYSCHVLEHMDDPKKCVKEWLELLKPGGHMILIILDSELYEQGCFPSTFNPDHKWHFTLNSERTARNLITVDELFGQLNGYKLISKELQDFNYDYSLISNGASKSAIFTGKILFKLVYYLTRLGVELSEKLLKAVARTLHKFFGTPIDQTLLFDATAQIQILVQRIA